MARLCPAAPSIEVVSAGRQPDPLGVLGRVAYALILSEQIPWPLLLSIIPLAILFSWVYNGTNGSLFMLLVFHALFDALGDFVYPLFTAPELLRDYVLIAAVASVVALLVVLATGPACLSRASKQVTTPISEAVVVV